MAEYKEGDLVEVINPMHANVPEDVTLGKVYEVKRAQMCGVTIREDDEGCAHYIAHAGVRKYQEPLSKSEEWIKVYQENDSAPEGGIFAGLTVYDTETSWYCYRETSPDSSDRRGGTGVVFHNSKFLTGDLDLVRAAAMLLVLAEEEAKL